MTMSKGHLKATMTRSAQTNQVIKEVCFILELKIATALNMVNVKVSSAWAASCATVATSLVSLYCLESDFRPISAKCQFFATAPMCAMLPDHVRYGTLPGTKLAAIFNLRGERCERLATMRAYLNGMFLGGFILALARTVTNFLILLVEKISAMKAWDVLHPCAPPSLMAVPGTKDGCGISPCASRLSVKRLPAMRAGKCFCFANRVYGAPARTMIDGSIVCSKLFVALEANLDHYTC